MKNTINFKLKKCPTNKDKKKQTNRKIRRDKSFIKEND
jgi:hypothetical protein